MSRLREARRKQPICLLGCLLGAVRCAKKPLVRLLSLRTVFVASVVASMAFSTACTKKDSGKGDTSAEAYKDIEKTFDESEPAPEARKPIEGVDTSELEKPMEVRFEALIDKLPSPCGEAHSLRTSRNTDTNCKRAPFATEYVFELTKDGASDSEIKELYALRFKETKPIEFRSAPIPRTMAPPTLPYRSLSSSTTVARPAKG